MKKSIIFFTAITSVFAVSLLLSPTTVKSAPFKSPSLGGTTGLISTPTAKTGWENAGMAVDLGYHYIGGGGGSHIPKATIQLFGKFEAGAAYDIQDGDNQSDLLMHSKFNFYNAGASALAIGGNLQLLNMGADGNNHTAGQVYLAVTYSGNFFSMPAETTVVLGKTFSENIGTSDIDFSMGFDLDFIPSVFKGYVHWINDFANYSYSVEANGSNAASRGCFNTGFRLALLRKSAMKFNIDVIMTDALDSSRSWAIGAAFGMAF